MPSSGRSPEEGYLMGQMGSEQYNDIPPVPVQHQMAGYGRTYADRGLTSVPEHDQQAWAQGQGGLGHTQSMRTTSTATPGMDNLGPAAVGGGISGIALGVANTHDRQSGIDAFRETVGPAHYIPAERGYHTTGADNPYIPAPPNFDPHDSSEALRSHDGYGSSSALGPAAAAPAGHWAAANSSQRSLGENPFQSYQGAGALNEGPYQRHSAYSAHDYPLDINPEEIVDDGDDGLGNRGRTAGVAAAGGAAAGGFFGGLFKDKNTAMSTTYGPVPGTTLESVEKGQLQKSRPNGGSRKRGWIVGIILAVIVIGAIVGGALGGTLGHRSSSNGSSSDSSSESASDDENTNGDLDKNSEEIKALLNNDQLHKVFPGVDYTPWGVQYPLCEKYPPSQNNVTRDLAVLSQLTNTIRLYGTDCNQTEMVLHAMDRLELTDMKLWLGVWIDTNDTTNDRQISKLYNILDNAKDMSIFKGAIVGNEALYRAGDTKESARQKLMKYIKQVKDHFSKNSIDIPVATSDLGDNWDQSLASVSDAVMSNIHPFFGGVTVDNAASWTWTFWQDHNVVLTKGSSKPNIISEVGWPSGGGNDCGNGANCQTDTEGAVAGVDEMNQFMSDWVCQALENGTDYFWFEAFDEPWKVQFNSGGEQWEDKWGLMDPARNLKKGLKIPDCGGKTAT